MISTKWIVRGAEEKARRDWLVITAVTAMAMVT